MSFEEDFPSLKDETFTRDYEEMNLCGDWAGEWVEKKSIQKCCLDKARVREAIMLTIQNECACPDDSECGSCHSLRLLYKRLGL